jgi:hypothetical protein
MHPRILSELVADVLESAEHTLATTDLEYTSGLANVKIQVEHIIRYGLAWGSHVFIHTLKWGGGGVELTRRPLLRTIIYAESTVEWQGIRPLKTR